MLNPAQINELAITPALALLPLRMDSVPARRMLLATQFQEDLAQRRRQWPRGPARGLLQFEPIACEEVLTNKATARFAEDLCFRRHVKPEPRAAWSALEGDDILAFGFGRLLYWRDPRPLPATSEDGWLYYIRNWAPGHPRPDDWPKNWQTAVETVG